MNPIPLFVEICAGTAAVSLRLERDGARPPVSRMGAKTGYADAILGALDLWPGQRAERYLWAEADPGVRLLLAAYTDRRLAQAAAEVIRGWAGEEPRALWERLRAEGPVKGPPPVDAREVARWLWVQGHGSPDGRLAAQYLNPDGNANGSWKAPPREWLAGRLATMSTVDGAVTERADVDPYEVARWMRIVSGNRLVNMGPDWMNTGNGGTRWGGEFATDHADLLRAAEAVGEVPGVVTDRADVDPREVARWVAIQANTLGDGGFNAQHVGGPGNRRPMAMGDLAAREAWGLELPGASTDRADIEPPVGLPAGARVMIDPPYVDTTKYAADFPRADVVTAARKWKAAGARVAVCEAEPIPELIDEGWSFVDIGHLRKGQKRTFSRQQREVLTLSEAPPRGWDQERRIGRALSLFGGGR